jgi:hypothetical protein
MQSCEIDCDHGHTITSDGDKVVGVLAVKKCSNKRFAKDISKSHAVAKQLSSLVNRYLVKKGVNVSVKIEFVKAVSNRSETLLHYVCNAKKEHHEQITAALRAVCKEKEVNIKEYTNIQ